MVRHSKEQLLRAEQMRDLDEQARNSFIYVSDNVIDIRQKLEKEKLARKCFPDNDPEDGPGPMRA